MKYCPDCRSTYTDKSLSYCLQDGSTLLDFKDASSKEKTALLNKETQDKLKHELKNRTGTDNTGNEIKSRTNEILIFLGLFVVGSIFGIVSYNFWQSSVSNKPETQNLTPQTNIISKSSMDALKFRAETNPESIIKQYETALPKDAQDFYILGRAFLKLKNYEEARKNFILARNNLREIKDAETRVVLDADITQGLMIAQDIPVQAAYDRVAKTSPLIEAGNQSNTNQ